MHCTRPWNCTILLTLLLAGCSKAHAHDHFETLLVIEPSDSNPRNTEGDIVVLKDGRLCLIYSRFGGDGTDFATADLAMRTSGDGGKTWTDDTIIVSGEEAEQNVMSVSILRLESGELLLFYLRKHSRSACNMYVRRSNDEFETVSDPARVATMEGYESVNNDRVVQLSTGRIIVPANMHSEFDAEGKPSDYQGWGVPFVYYSDDEGHTWHKDTTVITSVADRRAPGKAALQENGVVALKNGRLWMWMRTWSDYQYGCYSEDGGLSWSEPKPTPLVSPGSPATIERIPWTGDLICVWNDHSGLHPFPKEKPRNKRTPLAVAISQDEGATWSKSRVIEGNITGWFCYTSMTFVGDRVILAYMQRDESVTRQLGLKVIAISKDWLYPSGTSR